MDNPSYINEKTHVTLNQAKKLSQMGFNEYTKNAYVKAPHLSDEIRNKYAGLSDDGYYELAYFDKKEKPSKVYPRTWFMSNDFGGKNSDFKDFYQVIGFSMPELTAASSWLFKNKSIIAESFYDFDKNGFRWQVGDLNRGINRRSRIVYPSREDALRKAISEALKL